MTEPNLLLVCIAALIAVFTLLGGLALAMHLLTMLFPERSDTNGDPAALSAITAAAAQAFPGMRVTRIEEIQ